MKPHATVEKRETKVYHFVGLSMSQEELTWYLVIFGIILIIFCVLCFVLQKILIFTIIIVVFVILAYLYMYEFRNKQADE